MSKRHTVRRVLFSAVIAVSVILTGCGGHGGGPNVGNPGVVGVYLLLATFKLGKAVAGKASGGSAGKKMDRNDRANVITALEKNPDNAPMSWTNSRNGIAYQVTPVSDYVSEDNIRCRQYVTEAYARSRRTEFNGQACRTANGEWKEVKK